MRPLIALIISVSFFSFANAQVKTPVRNVLQKCFGPNCQQSQSAGFVVGSIDSDGAIVTSVGPVADPLPSMAPSLPTPEAGPVVVASSYEKSVVASGNRVSRQAFRKALFEARKEGLITLPQFALLYGSSFNPSKMATIEATINGAAEAEGLQAGAIDWVALIKLLLPILLQILAGL